MDDVVRDAIRNLIDSLRNGVALLEPFVQSDLAWTDGRAAHVRRYLRDELTAGIHRLQDSIPTHRSGIDKHELENYSDRWAAFVDGLVLSERPLRERLVNEYVDTLLPVVEGTIHRLPLDLAERLAETHAKLHAGTGAQGTVAKSISQMDDDEVRSIVESLLSVAHAVGAYALRFDEI